MGKEQKNKTEKKYSTGKGLWIIGIVIVVLAIIVGNAIYAAPANRMTRQLNLGQKYLNEQDYEQAVVAFNLAIEIDSKNVDAYIGLAQAYAGLGDMEQAVETYGKGIEVNPMVKDLYLGLAEIYETMGETENMLAILEQCWLKTGDLETKERLIGIYFAMAMENREFYAKSLNYFDKVLELDKEKDEIIEALNECLNQYIDVLKGMYKYDEIRALAEKYADVAVGIDFDALLREFDTLEVEAKINTFMENRQYDEIRTLVAQYKDAAVDVDFDSLLMEVDRREEEENEPIVFKEKLIEEVVREHINKPEGELCKGDVMYITGLAFYSSNATVMFKDCDEIQCDGQLYTLEDLRNFSSLRSLQIAGYKTLSDISALEELPDLACLELWDTSVSDINTLESLNNLECLIIDGQRY